MNKIKTYWCNDKNNAGDLVSKWLLEKLGYDIEYSLEPEIIVCGSILSWLEYNNTKIWGVGFHNYSENNINIKKENVYAVRGKMTAKKLNLNCITGDPGILVSKFYTPKTTKKYKFGIIPHYVDYDWVKSLDLQNIKLIKIETTDLEHLFDEINECEFILSSSLHGIIFSHSFGIPAFHFKHNELGSKKSFKFLDYYSNFNLKYMMKEIKNKKDFNFNEFELLYKNKEKFVPTKEEIEQNQNNLLSVFPFK